MFAGYVPVSQNKGGPASDDVITMFSNIFNYYATVNLPQRQWTVYMGSKGVQQPRPLFLNAFFPGNNHYLCLEHSSPPSARTPTCLLLVLSATFVCAIPDLYYYPVLYPDVITSNTASVCSLLPIDVTFDPLLVQCWDSVCNADSTFNQQRLKQLGLNAQYLRCDQSADMYWNANWDERCVCIRCLTGRNARKKKLSAWAGIGLQSNISGEANSPQHISNY